jgi:two-component system phosphate regulon sensor histidine kinase PhoR
MDIYIISLLAVVTLIAVFIAVFVTHKSKSTRDELKTLTEITRRMINTKPGHRAEESKENQTTELRETLEILESRLEQLETDLGNEREKLTAILATIGAGIVILDEEARVTVLNDTAAKLFRIKVERAIGQPFITLARDHEMDNIVRNCRESAQTQTGIVKVSTGRMFLELTATPLNNGIIVLVKDLTEIRRLEKIRSDFIANISHELRTPIASCKAIVETLQGGAVNEKKIAEDFLQRMQIETDKLAQMVNELGELSRIESGDLVLKLEPVDMAGVLDRVKNRLTAQADRAGLVIQLDVPPDLPRATGDKDRIEQVLVNLVHNAIKFTPESGSITISLRIKDEMILVSVQDTGIGIPEDDLPHIFERFYKVDKARSGGGTGLGLAIAKHIVQAHGGEIHAESREAEGSTFIFSLPVARS